MANGSPARRGRLGSQHHRATTVVHGEAFTWAFLSTLLGPALPLIRADLHLSYALGGFLFSASSFGFLLGALAAGILLDRVPPHLFALTGSLIVAAGLLGLAVSHGYLTALAAVAVTAVAGGALTTQANSAISDLFSHKRSAALSLVNVSFGGGALLAPFFASAVIAATHGWRDLYTWGVILLAPLVILAAVTRFPPRQVHNSSTGGAASGIGMGRLAVTRAGALMVLTTVVAAGIEWGYAYWSASYFTGVTHLSTDLAATFSSAFWAGMLLGRVVFGRILTRFSPDSVLAVACILTLVAGAGATLTTSSPVAAVSAVLLGATLAAVIPTLIGLLTDAYPTSSGAVSGLAMFAAGLGSLAAPSLIGVIARAESLRTAMIVIPAAAIILLGLQRAATQSLARLGQQYHSKSPADPTLPAHIAREGQL